MKKLLIFCLLAGLRMYSQYNALSFVPQSTVKLPYSVNLDFSLTSQFTVEGWFKTSSALQTIYSNVVNASPYNGVEIQMTSGNFAFSLCNTDVSNHLRVQTVASYNDNNWHHWAVTFDAKTGQRVIYRDGVPAVSDTAPPITGASTTFLIGKDGRIAQVWRKVKVDGHADEVLVAARAL